MIRLAINDDIPEILRIENLCFSYDVMAEEEAVDFISNDVLWSFDAEGIHGFLVLANDYIFSLAVDPQAQGRGIGRQLIQHAQKLKSTLTLHVKVDNVPANRLYKGLGFQEISRCTKFYDDGSDALQYWWRKDGLHNSD